MRLVNRLRYCLVAAIPAVALAACSSGSDGVQTGPPPEMSSIIIDAVPTADAAGLYIAEDNGYFAKQGLKVTIDRINGGEYGLGDLQTGKAQLIEGNYVSFILAQAAGNFAAPNPDPTKPAEPSRPINMRLIADSSQMQAGNQALYVLPSSPYKTVRDLVKHHVKVGVNSLHNIGSVLLGSLLTANGFKVDALTQVPEILPLMPQLLDQHKIPAAWLPEPFGTEAQQEYGAVQVADFNQGSLQNFPIGTIAGTASWVQSHPKHGRGVPARLQRGPAGRRHRPRRRGGRARRAHRRDQGDRRDDDARHLPACHGRSCDAAGGGRDVRVPRPQQAVQNRHHDPAGAGRDHEVAHRRAARSKQTSSIKQ